MTADALRDALRCDRPRCTCRRGRMTHCPAHSDSSPSFAVDQAGERLLVHCHGGCEQRAVIAALQARQLWPSVKPNLRKSTLRSPLEQARSEILQDARRQIRRLDGEVYQWSDEIRWCYQLVARAREVGTRLGADSETAWNLLEQAARLETATHAAELTA